MRVGEVLGFKVFLATNDSLITSKNKSIDATMVLTQPLSYNVMRADPINDQKMVKWALCEMLNCNGLARDLLILLIPYLGKFV